VARQCTSPPGGARPLAAPGPGRGGSARHRVPLAPRAGERLQREAAAVAYP